MNAIGTSIFSLASIGLGSATIASTTVAIPVTQPDLHLAQYEDFTLWPGFSPDPQQGSGRSGGFNFTEDCGYIDTAPDHQLTLRSAFDYLRIYVDADMDVTLFIETPNGDRTCYDNEIDDMLPEAAGRFEPGTYKLWIGHPSPEDDADYRIFITQQRDNN